MTEDNLPELQESDSCTKLRRILDIAADIEDHGKQVDALKAQLIEATRALSEINSRNDLLRVARYCEKNRKRLGIRQSDLAYALLGNENLTRKFRQLLADPYGTCTKCGARTLIGSQFESQEILCERCVSIRRSENSARQVEEENRKQQGFVRHRAERVRIRALRSLSLLTQDQAKELADLLTGERDYMDWVQRVGAKACAEHGIPSDLLVPIDI